MRKLLVVSLLLLPFVLQAQTSKLPPEKELRGLVFDSLFAFNKAVQKKDFAEFYEQRLSPEFRKQFPLAKFAAAFQVFIDKGYDISNIAKSVPAFDVPPAIDSDGLLVLEGHYPTRPNKVTFKLTYAKESSAWKLMGINVRANPVVENMGKVPSNRELKTLALDSLLLFNDAIQDQSFDKFYSEISELWQKEVTAEKLQEIFQGFIDQKIDLSAITKLEPAFDGTPAVNDDGLLVIKGSYPTRPSKVVFELKYVYENESWKLAGINVQVKPIDAKQGKEGKGEH